MVKPIRPAEVIETRIASLPDGVIEAWNELIVQNFSGNSATVYQDEATNHIANKMQCSKQEVYNKHWLDIEEVYRKVGWLVKYDKPGYNESYDAFFVFSKKVI